MPTRPRLLRFSLRGLLIAITLCAVGLGIVGAYVRRAERQRYIIGEVKRMGGTIFYADEHTTLGYERNYISEKDLSALRKRLGEGYYRTIDFVDISPAEDVPDELFAALAALPELRGLQVAPNVSQHPGVAMVRKAHPQLEVHEEWQVRHTFGDVASTPEEFEAALAEDHCVLFVDADWWPAAVAARPVLARFASSWTAKGERPRVSFVALDVSDPFGLVGRTTVTEKWMDSQLLPLGEMETPDRVGMVIWIENGREEEFRLNAHEMSQEELFRVTRVAFSPHLGE
jgi:hypothetical protein